MSTEKNRFDDALEDDMEEDDGAVRTAAASALPAHIAAAIDAAAAAVGSGVSMADYRAAEKVFDEALELFETASSDDGKRTKAYELFSRAAAARLPRGVCFLAQCTYEGVGVEANLQEAVRLWQEASKLVCFFFFFLTCAFGNLIGRHERTVQVGRDEAARRRDRAERGRGV